jgi:hypothetical protein
MEWQLTHKELGHGFSRMAQMARIKMARIKITPGKPFLIREIRGKNLF